MTPLVIDIHHASTVNDFSETKAAGIVAVFHKASEGQGFADPRYAARRKMWMDGRTATVKQPDGTTIEVPVKWGAYHFFHGNDPVAEAKFFLKCADPDPDTAVALDWERLRDGSYASQAKAIKFLQTIQDAQNRAGQWVYGGDVLKEAINGIPPAGDFWKQFHLWLCQYSSTFHTPMPWTLPDLWQNNGDAQPPGGVHHIAGIAGLCDNSCIVTGTLDDLLKKWAA